VPAVVRCGDARGTLLIRRAARVAAERRAGFSPRWIKGTEPWSRTSPGWGNDNTLDFVIEPGTNAGTVSNNSKPVAAGSAEGGPIVAWLLGRLEEARAEAAEVLRLQPNYTISMKRRIVVFRDPKDDKHSFDALLKAGLPE
jgi:hypothetical protein